jgi:hypothetical protein
MSLKEAIAQYCPFWTPRQFKGMSPESVKATMEMKLWRLMGWNAIPEYPLDDVINYLEEN